MDDLNPVMGTATTTIDGVHLIAQKYAPFGEYLNDPTTLAKFAKGFTNHEQTDPSGLIYMQARFYLPMYGRFASPDPARDQHFEQTQSWNIYSYVQNSPTMRIDPTGMEAWKIDKKWDKDQIAGYRKYAAGEAEKLQKSGAKMTCEDFAIKTVADYASAHGLPMTVVNGSGSFSASSDKFTDKDTFVNTVMKTTAASDLSNPANTSRVSDAPRGDTAQFKGAKPGDLVLFKSEILGQTRDSHVQVITGMDQFSARFAQGNTNEIFAKCLPWSANPTSPTYAGQSIESGTWGLGNGNYQRDGQHLKAGYAEQRNIDIRSWNFSAW